MATLSPPPNKKQRRRYDNNLKAQVLDELKNSGSKLPAVALKHGIPENTLREWAKEPVNQAIESARQKPTGGTLKANIMDDPLRRLSEVLLVELRGPPNTNTANATVPSTMPRMIVTTQLIKKKGLEVKQKLLKHHEAFTFLEPKELKALKAFTGSDSWAKKFAKRHNLPMNGARFIALEDTEVKHYSSELLETAKRMKKAGPAYEQVVKLLRQANDTLLAARRQEEEHK